MDIFTQLKTIIGFFRGTPGVTMKQAAKALLAILAIGVDQLPDTPTPVPTPAPGPLAITDPESAIQTFERLVQQHEAAHNQHAGVAERTQAVFSLPWATLLPILLSLFQKWISGGK